MSADARETAKRIAAIANECCYRADGYEEHIAMQIAAAITAAEARVREECAKIADKAADDAGNDAGIARSEGNFAAEERRLCEQEKAENIAAKIRARKP